MKIISFPSEKGYTLKRKDFGSKFFLLRIDSFSEGNSSAENKTRNYSICLATKQSGRVWQSKYNVVNRNRCNQNHIKTSISKVKKDAYNCAVTKAQTLSRVNSSFPKRWYLHHLNLTQDISLMYIIVKRNPFISDTRQNI